MQNTVIIVNSMQWAWCGLTLVLHQAWLYTSPISGCHKWTAMIINHYFTQKCPVNLKHSLIGSKDGSIRTLVLWVTICRSTIWAPILLLVTMVKCIIENYQSSQNTRFRSSDPQRDLDANLLFFTLEYIDGSRAVYRISLSFIGPQINR